MAAKSVTSSEATVEPPEEFELPEELEPLEELELPEELLEELLLLELELFC